MRRVALVALVVLLAGCADGGRSPVAPSEASDFEDLGVKATNTKGVLLGVVVDEAIRPILGASVAIVLADGSPSSKVTDDEGRFAFGDLEPGTYLVRATHLLYTEAQTSAEVTAGDDDPKVLRVMLSRLFTQEAFSEPYKFEGFIQCGYVAVILSSLCVNDYSTLAYPGGLYPQARETLDKRGYVSAVGEGWQTMIFELTWEPTTSATSSEMFILNSFYNRTASDAYARVGGANPVLMRMELGVVSAGAQGVGNAEDELIPPEGHPSLYTFAAIDGDNVAFGWSQKFTVYQHNFYYGKPPEGWSFIAGDSPPF